VDACHHATLEAIDQSRPSEILNRDRRCLDENLTMALKAA